MHASKTVMFKYMYVIGDFTVCPGI